MLYFIFAVAILASAVLGQETCDAKKRKYVINSDAQAHIGVILSLREAGQDGTGCGNMSDGAAQSLEAMTWTLSLLNQDTGQIGDLSINDSYIPGIKLGMTFEDSCSTPEGAIYSAMDMYGEFRSSEGICGTNMDIYNIGTIVGASSEITASMASLLSQRQLALVSYGDTRSSLSDKMKHPYFLRTTANDMKQAEAIVKIIRGFQWKSFSVLYSPDENTRAAKSDLLATAYKNGLCVAKALEVKVAEPRNYYYDIINQLLVTNATGVVYLGNLHGFLNTVDTITAITKAGRLQFIASTTVGNDKTLISKIFAKGMVSLTTLKRPIPEFENYFVSLDPMNPPANSPMLAESYMTSKQCKLPGVTSPRFLSLPDCADTSASTRRVEYVQYSDTETAIMSVYTYARALKNAHADLCHGVPGLCSALATLPSNQFFVEYLQTTDLTFTKDERIPSLASNQLGPDSSAKRISYDDVGDLENTGFDIWTMNDVLGPVKYHQVGSVVGDTLLFNPKKVIFYDLNKQTPLQQIPNSPCTDDDCSKCTPFAMHVLQSHQIPQNYVYYPGSIMVLASIAVHKPGTDPVSCGMIDSGDGAQMVEAFLYMLKQINDADIFPTWINIGGIVLDDCSSAERASSGITDLVSGIMEVKTKDGLTLDTDDIVAYIGGHNDPILSAVARLTTQLSLPLLSYRSANSRIKDKDTYPLLAGMVPGVDKQVEVIVSLLKQMEWFYIQVLYVNDEYGIDAIKAFRKTATKQNICIGSLHAVNVGTDMISQLRRNPYAKVVVTFMRRQEYSTLVTALDVTKAYKEFVFVTDVNWRDLDTVIKNNRDATHGFITTTFKDGSSTGFLSYLRNIQPSKYTQNPWFKEWYQDINDCYFDNIDSGRYQNRCTDRPITDSPKFELNDQTIHIMNAMYSITWGMDATLSHYCGLGYDRICTKYIELDDREKLLFENILDVWFNDDTMTAHYFKDRSGTRPMLIRNVNHGAYVQIGEYQFDGQAFFIRKSDVVNSLTEPIQSRCPGHCTECLYLNHVTDDVMYYSGDIIIAAAFDLHGAGSRPFGCSDDILNSSVQYAEALKYAIEQVNYGRGPVRLNGIRLGGLTMDSCLSDLRTADIISNIHFNMMEIKDKYENQLNIDGVLGWITNDDTGIQRTNVLQTLDLTHIVLEGNGNSDLGIISMSPNYPDGDIVESLAVVLAELHLRNINVISSTVDGFTEQIQDISGKRGICVLNTLIYGPGVSTANVIARLKNSPSHVAVLYLNGVQIVELLQGRDYIAPDTNIVFIIIAKENDTISAISPRLLKNVIIMQASNRFLMDFDTYLSKQSITDPTNPWLIEYFESLFECKTGAGHPYNATCRDTSPLTSSSAYKQDKKITNVMNSVYIMAKALHLTLVDFCGVNYQGLCEDLSNPQLLRVELKKRLVFIEFEDDTGRTFQLGSDGTKMPEYSIIGYDNRGETVKIGNYMNGKLSTIDIDWTRIAQDVVSNCFPDCDRCYQPSSSPNVQRLQGDVIIGGLFDVHVGGYPFRCGGININHGYQLAEVFEYAIQYINMKDGIFADKLRGITLGTLTLDVCQSPVKAVNILTDTLSGSLDENVDDLKKLIGFVGAFDTDISIEASNMLSRMHIPQISFGSPITQYSGKDGSPLFMRAVPSSDIGASVLVAILQKFEFRYIQVVHSESSYGLSSLKIFKKQALANNICIAQIISFSQNDYEQNISSKLRIKSSATVVVVLLDNTDVRPFLLSLSTSPVAAQTFKLIASQTWGNDLELLQDVGDFITNSISIGAEASDLKEFDEYLELQIPEIANPDNPWYKEYYEAMFECTLISTAPLPYQCVPPYQSPVRSPLYRQDKYAIHTVNSVFTIALALHQALEELCGQDSGICQKFWDNKNQLIKEKMKTTQFQDLSGQTFKLLQDGSSNKGFHIYSVSGSPGSFYYSKAGSYSDTHLTLRTGFHPRWNSKCKGDCNECQNSTTDRSKTVTVESPVGLNVVAFMPVHKASADNSLACGELDADVGFQNMLALFYATDRINSGVDFDLPDTIKLGVTVLDTCENKLSVVRNALALLTNDDACLSSGIPQYNYIGFIAMGNDDVNALRGVTGMVQSLILSPAAIASSDTSPDALVLTTKGSADDEGLVMAYVARQMSWFYVGVITSKDAYNKEAADSFKKVAAAAGNVTGVCVGYEFSLPHQFQYTDALNVVSEIRGISGLNVIVLFTSAEESRFIIRAISDLKLQDRFTLMGSTSWGDNTQITNGLNHVTKGSIVVQSHSEYLSGFEAYLQSLTFAEHGVIPDEWFEEFWQRAKHCRLENATKPIMHYTMPCSSDGRLSSSYIRQNPNILHTIIATHGFAMGLNELTECANSPIGLATCLKNLPNSARKLYEATKSISWTSQPGLMSDDRILEFGFNEDGFGNLGLSVANIHQDGSYVEIGTFSGGTLNFDIDRYVTKRTYMPISQCPSGRVCQCMHQTGNNGTGGRPETTAKPQAQISQDYYSNFSTSKGIALVVLTAIGIFVALLMFVYLLVAYPSRGGTSVLGYLLLVGVMLIYSINFAFLLHPNATTCSVRRCGQGYVYALCFACMLIKVMINWQQEDDDYLPKYKKLKHPASLFFMAFGLSIVQGVVALEWIILRPSLLEVIALDNGDIIPVCAPSDFHNKELLISSVGTMLLMFLTLVFAVFTWESTDNSRESRWIIAVTCINTLVWCVWGTLSCLVDYDLRDTAIITANLINATTILLFIFVRKLYLLNRYVQQEKVENQLRIPAIVEFSNHHSKEALSEPAMAYVYPTRTYQMESPRSGKGSERFYFENYGADIK